MTSDEARANVERTARSSLKAWVFASVLFNDVGQVVGNCSQPDLQGEWRAFIWQNGVMTDLNDLIPADADLLMTLPTAINDAGQITGWAKTPPFMGAPSVAVLLTPPPPVPGDLDGDCTVGVIDLLSLLSAWGPCLDPCPPTCFGDMDADCNVGVIDLLLLLANWNQ